MVACMPCDGPPLQCIVHMISIDPSEEIDIDRCCQRFDDMHTVHTHIADRLRYIWWINKVASMIILTYCIGRFTMTTTASYNTNINLMISIDMISDHQLMIDIYICRSLMRRMHAFPLGGKKAKFANLLSYSSLLWFACMKSNLNLWNKGMFSREIKIFGCHIGCLTECQKRFSDTNEKTNFVTRMETARRIFWA